MAVGVLRLRIEAWARLRVGAQKICLLRRVRQEQEAWTGHLQGQQ